MASTTTAPPNARLCRCPNPLRDDDSCLRCGRTLPQAPPALRPRERREDRANPWPREGVIRAIRSFRFHRGRFPHELDWKVEDGNAWPSVAAVEGLFGSLPAALAAAGADHENSAWRTS
jgi:hypothetical protein